MKGIYMKQLFAVICLLTVANMAYASLKGAPYQPEVDQRFDALENVNSSNAERSVKVTYDVVANGTSSVTPIGLGQYLPAKAVVTKVLTYIDTQFVDDGTGSVQLQCEDSANLMASTDITGYAVGAVHLGVPNPATPTVTDSIAAQCEIKAVEAACYNCRLPSAGKIEAFINYIIKN
jgi:hypothetical protein